VLEGSAKSMWVNTRDRFTRDTICCCVRQNYEKNKEIPESFPCGSMRALTVMIHHPVGLIISFSFCCCVDINVKSINDYLNNNSDYKQPVLQLALSHKMHSL
jgi:hypothetical protein